MLEEHLEKLRAFHVTASEGSFLKASERLRLTQPAITKAVQILERQMKVNLFIRHARGVSLTAHGKALNDFCESLFLRIRDLEQKITREEALAGVVRIGTHEMLAESFCARVLSEAARKCPGIAVELTTENIETHWSRLESGSIDLVVSTEPPYPGRFYSRLLYSDRFGLFCKAGSPFLKAKTPVPISYVKKAFDHLGVNIEQHLAQFSPGFNLRYTVESFPTVRALVAEGVCVGAIPCEIATKTWREGALVTFPAKEKLSFFADYRVCATSLHDFRHEPKIAAMMDIMRDVGKTWAKSW